MQRPSYNAWLPMRYCTDCFMFVNEERHLSYQRSHPNLAFNVGFGTNDLHDHLHKISYWKTMHCRNATVTSVVKGRSEGIPVGVGE